MKLIPHLELLLERLGYRAERLDKRSRRYSYARLVIFVIGLGAVIILVNLVYANVLAPIIVAVTALFFLVLFLFVALKHDTLEKARKRLFLWQRIQERHLSRLNLDWDNLTYSGLQAAKSHPHAIDLDITGPRSLLHLIDTTTTVGGRKRLEKWVLEHPIYEEIPRRQAAVRSLVKHRRFRDRLALHGLELAKSDELFDYSVIVRRSRITGDNSLLDWRGKGLIASSILNLIMIGVHLSGGPMWWPYSLVLYFTMYASLISKVIKYIEHLFRVNRALSGLFDVMIWVNGYSKRIGNNLAYLWEVLEQTGAPDEYKKRLNRFDSAIAFSQSEITRFILNIAVPYDFLVLVAYERMLHKLLPLVEQWIDVLSELEGLSALATYADFHRERISFPTLLLDNAATQVVRGTALTHPLMPKDDCIPNDVQLTMGKVGVITGSNMSGKSTYLRAVGLASLMAWAGGPVCATHFEASPVRIYTSMRIGDVLQEGKSTFYAEVERLSIVIHAINRDGQPPVLVLLDEILRGTNTKERLIGVNSIVTHLAGAKAMSFIATHDQEITYLADEHPEISNFHFRERLEDGRLHFEYRIHDGPSDTTNALYIMQEAGLPIQHSTPEHS